MQNVLIAKTNGVTDLPAQSTTPIFVSRLFSGSGVVSHAFLTFSNEETRWVRGNIPPKLYEAQNIVYTGGDSPRVTADIHNASPEQQKRIYFVATLFGVDGKALASSATILESIPAQGSTSAVFTWPTVIDGTVARIEIRPVSVLP